MSCVEQMKYKLYLERTSFREAREFIERNSDHVYYVEPGYKIFKDYYIIGVPPIALGAKGRGLVFTYVKPCHGTFVMAIESEEEIQRLSDKEAQEDQKSKLAAMLMKRQSPETLPISFHDLWKR
jgi:hypothetical protein